MHDEKIRRHVTHNVFNVLGTFSPKVICRHCSRSSCHGKNEKGKIRGMSGYL